MAGNNMCVCTAKSYHTERSCVCPCHGRIRRDAAVRAAQTRAKGRVIPSTPTPNPEEDE